MRKPNKSDGYDPNLLPRLPKSEGGETDLIVGINYLKNFPEWIFRLSIGLTFDKSIFRNSDGYRGVVAGPNCIFKEIEKHHFWGHWSMEQYRSEQVRLVKMGYSLSLIIPLLSIKETVDIPTIEILDIESDTVA